MCGTAWNPPSFVFITDEMVSETLHDAADLLEQGWCKRAPVRPHLGVEASYEQTYNHINLYIHGGVDRCASQALIEASILKIDGIQRFPGQEITGTPAGKLYKRCTNAFLDEAGYDPNLEDMDVPHYNDHIAENAQQVIDMMRAAAKSVLK